MEITLLIMKNHGIVYLNFCGNPESNPLRCIDIISGKKNEIMKCGIDLPFECQSQQKSFAFVIFWHTVYFQIRRLLYEQAELGPQSLP